MAIIIEPRNIYDIPSNKKVKENKIDSITYSENNISLSTTDVLSGKSFRAYLDNETLNFDTAILDSSTISTRNNNSTVVTSTTTITAPSTTSGTSGTKYFARLDFTITISGTIFPSDTPIFTFEDNLTRYISSATTETNSSYVEVSTYDTLGDFDTATAGTENDFTVGIIRNGTSGNSLHIAYKVCYLFTYTHKHRYYDLPSGHYITETTRGRLFLRSKTMSMNYITYATTEKDGSYGVGSNTYSLDSNELRQVGSIVREGTLNDVVTKTASSHFLSQKIVEKWTNGKETATLLLDYGEYYDENNNLVKSIITPNMPMRFYIGDEVIPYVKTYNNKTPISKNNDGTTKTFKIIGVETIYNGACWQQVTLLEK